MSRIMLSRVAAGVLLVCVSYYLLTIGLHTSRPAQVDLGFVAPAESIADDIYQNSHSSAYTDSAAKTEPPVHVPSKEPAYTTNTWASLDHSVQHYIVERPESKYPSEKSVLFLTITAGNQSWGRNPAEEQRSIYSHLDLVTNTTLLPEQASIGLLTSSPSEYLKYIKIFTPPSENAEIDPDTPYFDYDFRRVVLVLHTADTRAPPNGTETLSKTLDSSREARHNIPQHERRAILAKLRNYLSWAALTHETHVAWLDSDVYKYNSDTMIETMMERTSTTNEAEVGVLTSRCRRGEPEKAEAWMAQHPEFVLPDQASDSDTPEVRKNKDLMRGQEGGKYEIMAHKTNAMGHYDLNAWSGTRTTPSEKDQAKMWKDISAWTPSGKDATMLDGLISNTDGNDIRRLDSVGGTILMINAELIRMGLIWPTGYFVAMSYEHGEGYDGIESEGLCLLTRSFSRDGESMCFTMGGEWSVWHTVF